MFYGFVITEAGNNMLANMVARGKRKRGQAAYRPH